MAASAGERAAIEAALRARGRRRQRAAATGLAGVIAALWLAAWMCDATPSAIAAGLPRMGEYFHKLLPALRWHALLGGPRVDDSLAYWFYRLDDWAWLLLETTQMAALATLAAAALAVPAAFLAAVNLSPHRAVRIGVRRGLELCRTVPDLVYALIFVWAFGVGPLAGILAIALHGVGALGKLFAEAVENIDMRAVDGVRASGANWVQTVRFAALPQVLPDMLSVALLRFEINVRGAAVIGFVGAGGIGQELYYVISSNYYEEVSAILVLIVLVVFAIDAASEWLRSRAMAGAAA